MTFIKVKILVEVPAVFLPVASIQARRGMSPSLRVLVYASSPWTMPQLPGLRIAWQNAWGKMQGGIVALYRIISLILSRGFFSIYRHVMREYISITRNTISTNIW
jgi:hypothetical protein